MTYKIKQPKEKYRKTYDLYVGNKKYLNFNTKEDAKNFVIERNLPQTKIKEKKSKPFQIGEMWRDDFDYDGMIRTGSEAKSSWGIVKLNKLFDSYEDVNYHQESESLYEAIKELEKGNEKEADKKLNQFRKINKKILKKWHTQ